MSTNNEPWQEYDCPNQVMDMDLWNEDMVYHGQRFLCLVCGEHHTAGMEVDFNTYTADRRCVELPPTPEALQELKLNPTTYGEENG